MSNVNNLHAVGTASVSECNDGIECPLALVCLTGVVKYQTIGHDELNEAELHENHSA